MRWVGGHRSGWRGQQGAVPEARRMGTSVALIRSGCGVGWRGEAGAGGPDQDNSDNHGRGRSQRRRGDGQGPAIWDLVTDCM